MPGSHFLAEPTSGRFDAMRFTVLTWPAVLSTLCLYFVLGTLTWLTFGLPDHLAVIWPFFPPDGTAGVFEPRYTLTFFVGTLCCYPLGRFVELALAPYLPDFGAIRERLWLVRDLQERVPGGDPFALHWKPFGLWALFWILLSYVTSVFTGVVSLFGLAAWTILYPWGVLLPYHLQLAALLTGILLWATYPLCAIIWWHYTESDYYRHVVKDEPERLQRTLADRLDSDGESTSTTNPSSTNNTVVNTSNPTDSPDSTSETEDSRSDGRL